MKKFGTIHAAICSAAVSVLGATLPRKGLLKTDSFQRAFDINLMGSVFVAKYASIAMSKNNPNEIGERGAIIFVSSIQADEGPSGMLAYAMTKGGINGMVMPMARDLGKFGVRVAAL